jgi:hypothetical protein
MRYEVEQIDPMSLGTIAGVLYGAMGLLSWLFIPFFLLLPMDDAGAAVAMGGMTIFFLLMPLFYAVIGFIGGLVIAAVYNLWAKHFGGLRLTLKSPGSA